MVSAEPPPLHTTGVVHRDADGARWLAVPRSACGSCTARCGLSKMAATQVVRFPLPTASTASPGEMLAVQFPAAALTRAAAIGYLLPALGLVIGAALGNPIGGDPSALAGALLGLAAGLAVTRRIRNVPVRIIPADQAVACPSADPGRP